MSKNEPTRAFCRLWAARCTFQGHRWSYKGRWAPKKKNPLLSPLLELKRVSRKFFNSNCSKSIQLGKVQSRSMKSLRMQIQGANKIRNHVLYLTPLIALEIQDKEGAVVDIIFFPPWIRVPDRKKSKIIIFFPWVCKSIQNDMVRPVRVSEHPKCPFLAKMPIVSPKFDQRSNEVQTHTKQRFSQFYIKPKFLGDF